VRMHDPLMSLPVHDLQHRLAVRTRPPAHDADALEFAKPVTEHVISHVLVVRIERSEQLSRISEQQPLIVGL